MNSVGTVSDRGGNSNKTSLSQPAMNPAKRKDFRSLSLGILLPKTIRDFGSLGRLFPFSSLTPLIQILL